MKNKLKKSNKMVGLDMSLLCMPLMHKVGYNELGQKLLSGEPFPPSPGSILYFDAMYGKKGKKIKNDNTITASINTPTFEIISNPQISLKSLKLSKSEMFKAMGYEILEIF